MKRLADSAAVDLHKRVEVLQKGRSFHLYLLKYNRKGCLSVAIGCCDIGLHGKEQVFMKKRFYGVMVVCLLGAVFFMGCGSDAPEEPVEQKPAVNGVVVPAGADVPADVQQKFPVFLGGATELKPSDRLIYTEIVVIEEDDTEVMFQVSCPYGNAAKLKVYYGSRKGQTESTIAYLETSKDESEGKLTATLPAGTWYFTIENGGSHNILVESATMDLQ